MFTTVEKQAICYGQLTYQLGLVGFGVSLAGLIDSEYRAGVVDSRFNIDPFTGECVFKQIKDIKIAHANAAMRGG